MEKQAQEIGQFLYRRGTEGQKKRWGSNGKKTSGSEKD